MRGHLIHRYVRRFICWINTPSDEETNECRLDLARQRLSYGDPPSKRYGAMGIAERKRVAHDICNAARVWDFDPAIVKKHLAALK